MVRNIAIQGVEGCFHQQAAQEYFGENTKVIPCNTFRKLVDTALYDAHCDGAVMAIENSIAGSILPNYNLLQHADLKIKGEVYLAIEQQLMVLPGTNWKDIKEVHSHPMALLQCSDYLGGHNWKLVETEDTALSAAYVGANKLRHLAAIASTIAADIYGLEIVASGIQNNNSNYTRFLVLSREENTCSEADKASVYFRVPNVQGSLADILNVVASFGINLSKLQSFPVSGSDWQYFFHADLEFQHRQQIEECLAAMGRKAAQLRVYGLYKKGRINHEKRTVHENSNSAKA
ncbi:MAG: prephenate dehydratase [Edaphocola sp.]